jgi:hypothetical protein
MDMADDLKKTVSIWKMTVPIWDILSLWYREYCPTVGRGVNDQDRALGAVLPSCGGAS